MGFPMIPHPFRFIHAAEEGIDAIGYGGGSRARHRDIHGIGLFLFGQQFNGQ
jgi:hypothetical protein